MTDTTNQPEASASAPATATPQTPAERLATIEERSPGEQTPAERLATIEERSPGEQTRLDNRAGREALDASLARMEAFATKSGPELARLQRDALCAVRATALATRDTWAEYEGMRREAAQAARKLGLLSHAGMEALGEVLSPVHYLPAELVVENFKERLGFALDPDEVAFVA